MKFPLPIPSASQRDALQPHLLFSFERKATRIIIDDLTEHIGRGRATLVDGGQTLIGNRQSAIVIGRWAIVEVDGIGGRFHDPMHGEVKAHSPFIGHENAAAGPHSPSIGVLQLQCFLLPFGHNSGPDLFSRLRLLYLRYVQIRCPLDYTERVVRIEYQRGSNLLSMGRQLKLGDMPLSKAFPLRKVSRAYAISDLGYVIYD
jgi:hypothetical protein